MTKGRQGFGSGGRKGPGANRIHGAIAHDLGVAILGGRYASGDTLSGEIEFSEHLNVSRSAYREAIRILSAKGLVESRPKTGTRVSPRSNWNMLDPDVLAWAFESEPSPAFIRDLFELRMIVEPEAAALAAERRTGQQLSRMGHALERMAEFGLATVEGRDADQQFHHTVLEATRNEPLMSLSSSIGAAVSWTTVFKQRARRLPRDPMDEHRALYDAIADGDPVTAREAMRELIRLALADTEMSLDG
ncbi:FadR/GntR family transcriptional regulator [Sphingomonas flavalba]|uniref:FadR/GntR family transcriptional regulator n=1 Tax=Sphingomonas flavalba TaxID=2559804 RepID=UPI00109E1518|nr:FadR/GntR family transcriptional regulator [Sphingomonas flavalba]